MPDKKSIADKIKDHPVAALLTLFGAGVIGVASVTESLGTASEKLQCLPSYLGFSEGYTGKGTLKYSIQTRDWVRIGTYSKTKGTGNHGCYKNCKGEPTRTNYQIHMAADEFRTPKLGDRKLESPKLSCKSGPCAWSQPLRVGLEADNRSASASFDVWSNPTSWELTAEVLEYQVVSEKLVEKDLVIGPEPLLEISTPSNAVSSHFSGSMEDGQPFSFELGKNTQNSVLEYRASTKRSGRTEHLYVVLDNRCT